MWKKQVLFIGLGIVVAAALALVLVEVVPNPPLMAPELKPSPNMIGTWKGTARLSTSETSSDDLLVRLEILPGGEVTGWVGGARIRTARLANNRSWLGELLGIRTSYIILGEAALPSGEHEWEFTVPVEMADSTLKGTLFIEGRPRYLTLFRAEERVGT